MEAIATEQIVNTPLALIHESERNPRKNFAADSLSDLAKEIKAKGLLVPVILRPHPDKPGRFELIDGARRYRACELNEATDIASIIREVGDKEAQEMRVTSFLRDGISPIEEAIAYRGMIDSGDYGTGIPAVNAVAVAVGKKSSSVYQRLQLLKACTEAQDECAASAITANHLVEIARFGDSVSRQEECLTHLLYHSHREWDESSTRYVMVRDDRRADEPPSIRQFKQWLKDRQPDLGAAPFPTTSIDLVPSAGACSNCPKRTGFDALMRGEEAGEDRCLDLPCFVRKMYAHVAEIALRLEGEGKRVSLIAFAYDTQTPIEGREVLNSYDWKEGGEEFGVVVKAGGAPNSPKIGDVIRITRPRATDAASVAKREVDVAIGKRKAAVADLTRRYTIEAVESAIPKKLDTSALRLMCQGIFSRLAEWEQGSICALFGWTEMQPDPVSGKPSWLGAAADNLPTMKDKDLGLLLLRCSVVREIGGTLNTATHGLAAFAGIFGVDLKAVKARAEGEIPAVVAAVSVEADGAGEADRSQGTLLVDVTSEIEKGAGVHDFTAMPLGLDRGYVVAIEYGEGLVDREIVSVKGPEREVFDDKVGKRVPVDFDVWELELAPPLGKKATTHIGQVWRHVSGELRVGFTSTRIVLVRAATEGEVKVSDIVGEDVPK